MFSVCVSVYICPIPTKAPPAPAPNSLPPRKRERERERKREREREKERGEEVWCAGRTNDPIPTMPKLPNTKRIKVQRFAGKFKQQAPPDDDVQKEYVYEHLLLF